MRVSTIFYRDTINYCSESCGRAGPFHKLYHPVFLGERSNIFIAIYYVTVSDCNKIPFYGIFEINILTFQ